MKISLACLVLLSIAAAGFGAPAALQTVDATVTLSPDRSLGPLKATLFGTNVLPGDKSRAAKPEFIANVVKMGIKSCRFPNGCVADIYNWKSVPTGQFTPEEFLDFCDSVGAEPYYTVNMQGGTEGLAGPVPAGASLEDRIRYQHTAPNPCGNTNYHFGTLAETLELVQKCTVDRALAGRKPLLCYEMGNENWGQSTTDWPPEVYAKTVEVYARAMRGLLDKAKREHPEALDKLELQIVAVGYPVMGNNMKLVDSPDRKINLAWTSGLNQLYDEKLISSVQEHFYPYGSANGGTLAWAVHNLHNIIDVRKNKPNSRLNGYSDPQLAYKMPMEHTEWNVKCWGGLYTQVPLANPGFEEGAAGWKIDGDAKTSDKAARRGANGLLIAQGKCTVSQVIDLPSGAKVFSFSVWLRTDRAGSVTVSMIQANQGEHQGQSLSTYSPGSVNTWENVAIGGRPFADTKQVEVAVTVDGPAKVFLDEASFRYSPDERGQVAQSALTYEQDLFAVDALREMALGGCPRAHIHHISGDYACGQTTDAGDIKDLGKTFEFFSGAYGDTVVPADCKGPNEGYHSQGNSIATDFNALAPDRDDIPMLGCLASRKGLALYLLLINRSSDRDINVKIDVGADLMEDTAELRTLSGTDIDLPGATVQQSTIEVGRSFAHTIHPYSAEIISMVVKK